MVEAAAHEKINIYTYSEVEKVAGFVGDFTVDIRKKREVSTWTNVQAVESARKSVLPKRFQMSSTEAEQPVSYLYSVCTGDSKCSCDRQRALPEI